MLNVFIVRAAYNSALMENEVPVKAVNALLPLFREHANTPSMIRHAMLLIKKTTEYLHPGKYIYIDDEKQIFV